MFHRPPFPQWEEKKSSVSSSSFSRTGLPLREGGEASCLRIYLLPGDRRGLGDHSPCNEEKEEKKRALYNEFVSERS